MYSQIPSFKSFTVTSLLPFYPLPSPPPCLPDTMKSSSETGGLTCTVFLSTVYSKITKIDNIPLTPPFSPTTINRDSNIMSSSRQERVCACSSCGAPLALLLHCCLLLISAAAAEALLCSFQGRGISTLPSAMLERIISLLSNQRNQSIDVYC